MSYKLIATAIAAMLLMGCAQLRINVDVYRGPIPVAWDQASHVATTVQNATNEAARVAPRTSILDKIDCTVLAAYDKKFANDPATKQIAKRAWPNVKQLITLEWQKVDNAAKELYGVASTLQINLQSEPMQRVTPKSAVTYATLRALQNDLNSAWKSFVSKINRVFIDELKIDTPAEITAMLEEIQNTFTWRSIAASDSVEGRLVGTPLFDARIAALSREEKDWTKFADNSFDAFGGTSQFVVVREGSLVYHQKSLDFDPTSAVGAGSALTRLGLKMGAALASGIAPLPALSNADSKTTTTSVSMLFDADGVEKNRLLLERRRNARQQLLRATADLLERLTVGPQTGAVVDSINDDLNREITYYLSRTANIAGDTGAAPTR